MKHRILLPIPIHGIGIKTFEELALPLEEAFERGEEKTLPEATRASEEVIPRAIYNGLHILCLIHIEIIILADYLERLLTYRIFD